MVSEKLKTILERQDIRVAIQTNDYLGGLIKNNKSKRNQMFIISSVIHVYI